MNLKELASDDHQVVRTYEYDDATVMAADLRIPDEKLSLDVVGGTGILVVRGTDEERQFEFDVPAGDVTKAIINNGVITVEVTQ